MIEITDLAKKMEKWVVCAARSINCIFTCSSPSPTHLDGGANADGNGKFDGNGLTNAPPLLNGLPAPFADGCRKWGGKLCNKCAP